MDLSFEPHLAASYRNPTQKIKNLSEHWFGKFGYCPHCGQGAVARYPNNQPVADFVCTRCLEEYELKSLAGPFGRRIADGAYRTMMERLRSSSNPNLVLLRYDRSALSVVDLVVIPKFFFVPEVIEQRRPLSPTAQRAGWIGCNIALSDIPAAGRIAVIRHGEVLNKSEVLAAWRAMSFLRQQPNLQARGWLLSVMRCIEKLGKANFTIADMYRFEVDLAHRFPANRHLRAKIRQQLQVLRDQGYLEFLGSGTYRLARIEPG